MQFLTTLVAMLLVAASSPALAQTQPAQTQANKFVTVPITLDHNRIVIDIYLPLPDGSTKRVRGWVNTGDTELKMSARAAKLMGISITCDANPCTAPAPHEAMIGDLKISLDAAKKAIIPQYPSGDGTLMAPGMSPEIEIPSSVLRNYDVLINYPDREFTIAQPGSLKFKGVSSKIKIAANGLAQIPGKFENKSYNFVLDLGAPVAFLSQDIFDKLLASHPDAPHMTGAVGPANMWGTPDEVGWNLMRAERWQVGPLYLTGVPVIAWPQAAKIAFEKTSSTDAMGLLGANALLNYRVGLDYAHSTVYFDIGSTFRFPDFDVVGLVLRPDPDTRFTIIGVAQGVAQIVAQIDGQPSVAQGQAEDGVQPGDHLVAVDNTPVTDSTMGQVWSLLEGSPGQERKLTIERGGKQLTVAAKVQHFLAEPEGNDSAPKRKK